MGRNKLVSYKELNEFFNDIAEHVDAHHFGHYLFIKAVDRLLSRQEDIYSAYTVKSGEGVSIIYMWTTQGQYLFGNFNGHESLKLITKVINYNEAKKSGFFGNKKIIENLIYINQLSFSLKKSTFYYTCKVPIQPLRF